MSKDIKDFKIKPYQMHYQTMDEDDSNLPLDYAHFILLTNSPGNQVKLLMNYALEDSSLFNKPVNAVMEVYGTNQWLIRVSLFPQPLIANQSSQVQLATTFTDENINKVIVIATFIEQGKLVSISNPVTMNLNLGQIIEW